MTKNLKQKEAEKREKITILIKTKFPLHPPEKKAESVFPTDGTLFDLEKNLKRTKEKNKAKGKS